MFSFSAGVVCALIVWYMADLFTSFSDDHIDE